MSDGSEQSTQNQQDISNITTAPNFLEEFGTPICSYDCKGYLIFDAEDRTDVEYHIDFRCVQLTDSKIYIQTIMSLSDRSNVSFRNKTFKGFRGITIQNGKTYNIAIKDAFFLNGPLSPPELSQYNYSIFMASELEIRLSDYQDSAEQLVQINFLLTNLVFKPNDLFKGARDETITQGISLDIDDCKIELHRLKSYTSRVTELTYRKISEITARLSIIKNGGKEYEIIERSLDICSLLSFLRETKITWYCWERVDTKTKQLIARHHCNVLLGTYNESYAAVWKPNYLPSIEVKDFLETTLQKFIDEEKIYSLKKVIDALIEAKREATYSELSGLTVGANVDILRARWGARNDMEFIFEKKTFDKKTNKSKTYIGVKDRIMSIITLLLAETFNKVSEEQIDAVEQKLGELNRYPFKMVLFKMMENSSLKVTKAEIDRFVDIRNALVHEGRFLEKDEKGNTKSALGQLDQMFAFADKVILTLLDYKLQIP